MDGLTKYLTGRADWRSVHVWREGFTDWQTAGDVAEVAQLISRPPPPPQARPIEKPEPKKRFSGIKKVLAGLAVVIAIIVGHTIGRPIGREVANTLTRPTAEATAEVVGKGFAEAVRQTKPTLPKKVDDLTTMIDVESNGMRMIYRYSVNTGDINTEGFTEAMRKIVVPKVCASDTMKKTLGYGATYEYSYIGIDSKSLGNLVVSLTDCT